MTKAKQKPAKAGTAPSPQKRKRDGKPITPQKDRKQPTKAEIERRTEAVQQMLILCQTDGQIKKACAAKWGCEPRSVEPYLRRARDANVAESDHTTAEWRADQVARYMRFAADDSVPEALRLKALERIDKLHGLEKNTLVHQHEDVRASEARGTVLEMQSSPDFVEYLRIKSAANDAEECDIERDPSESRDDADGVLGDDTDEA